MPCAALCVRPYSVSTMDDVWSALMYEGWHARAGAQWQALMDGRRSRSTQPFHSAGKAQQAAEA